MFIVVLPDKPQAVPAYGRELLSMVSYGRKLPFADIDNSFEEIEILWRLYYGGYKN